MGVAKAIAHWLTTGLPLTIAAPVLGVLLHLPNSGYSIVALTLLLGTPALVNDWHIRRGTHRRHKARRLAALTPRAATLRPDADFRGRGGTARHGWA